MNYLTKKPEEKILYIIEQLQFVSNYKDFIEKNVLEILRMRQDHKMNTDP
jgi:hypothetical protein